MKNVKQQTDKTEKIFKKKKETNILNENDFEKAQQYICFMLGEEEFGINIVNIREVIPMSKYTRVNNLPEFAKGVINLRGEIIALLDIKLFFKITDYSYKHTRRTKIIITRDSGRDAGFIVDYVTAARMISENNIQPTPKNVEGISAEYISGVVHTGDRPIILLNVNKILFSEAFAEFQ
ncbi:purine-binding chemotaxis protein CheW [Candidatus Dependentiae bacterium]|nr:purine-binding chemotaxis protein CheW [Candidatus Dependentiae bacterium]